VFWGKLEAKIIN